MPLWLQGVFELGQAAVISALLVVLPVAAVWLTGGFADRSPESAARLAGQGWLVMHGVPLVLQFPAGVAGDGAVAGLLHVVPLGLVLIPHELVPLHIFEERYKLMIGECIEEEREFGIVWLSDDGLKEIGCSARISKVLERFEDGRMNVLVEGSSNLANSLPFLDQRFSLPC